MKNVNNCPLNVNFYVLCFFILFVFRSIIYRHYRYDILDYIYLKINFSIKNQENKNNTLNHNKTNRIILIILILS